MVNSIIDLLLSYLDSYKYVIKGGYISEDCKSRSDRILNEIVKLEEMIQSNTALNNYDFAFFKREAASVLNSDHFNGVPGVISNPDAELKGFLSTLSDIESYINDGIEIKFNSKEVKRNREQESRSSDDVYERLYQKKPKNTFDFISGRFNARFKNIPSNEEDYTNILTKFEMKLDSCREQLDIVKEEIENLQKLATKDCLDRHCKTTSQYINDEYNKMCMRLYNAANVLYTALKESDAATRNRFKELSPLMLSKEEEWNAIYSTLVKKHDQLIKDYNIARSMNDNRQMKFLEKRITEVEKEIKKKDEISRPELKRTIASKIVSADSTYNQLYKKYLKAKKRFEKADRNYKKITNNPKEYKEKLRKRTEKKYDNLLDMHTRQIMRDNEYKQKLEHMIAYYAREIIGFQNKYYYFAPSKRKSR